MDMQNKLCMVTGATSGIGLVTARVLAERGAAVILVGRNEAKTRAATAAIRDGSGNQAVSYLLCDFSSQRRIRELAGHFAKDHDHLDLLVNNAGGVFPSYARTEDGIERSFAVDHLGYFLLTNLLLEALLAGSSARVVNVASEAHRNARIHFDDLGLKGRYSAIRAYAQAKLANILFTYELARRLQGSRVTANALHPGVVATNIWSAGSPVLGAVLRPLSRLFGISAEEGAKTSIHLAGSPMVEGVSGRYFIKRKPVDSSPVSYDQQVARRLWEVSASMTGLGESAG